MKLYNTLSGKTETFSPSGDTVKMYVCGITPYSTSHVGHALKAVVFDVLRRYLEFRGHKVQYVENFTDIDDKMIQAAARQGVPTAQLAEDNIAVYLAELDALNVLRAHNYPKATEEVPKMLQIIGALVERGMAYAAAGDVYFRVRERPDYGKLSGRSLDSMKAGARVEVDENKEDVMDFVLWKRHKPGEPSWDSPWGPGRPGWHIECSAMSLAYLGETIDIHGGGQELIFPHHENEIAQSESYTGSGPLARFWVHNGLLRLGDDKMSKSLGNLVTVGEALKRFTSDALRLFFLSSHYRSPLSYSDQGVAAQERGAGRLRNALSEGVTPGERPPLETETHREAFIQAMDDDLNTPRASAALFDLAHDINRAREEGLSVERAQDTLRELAGVLGLTLEAPSGKSELEFFPLFHLMLDTDAELRSSNNQNVADGIRQRLEDHGIAIAEFLGSGDEEPEGPETMSDDDIAALIGALIEARSSLRAAKQYGEADQIRKRLAELGYMLEDTPRGTEWKRGVS